jgi:RND superfamily putative drug exporter
VADSAARVRRSLLTLPASPRLKWAFLAVWLLIAFAIVAGDLPAKFDDAQNNESSSFLPGDAESTQALDATEQIQGDELLPIVIVYQRAAGKLDRADLERVASDRATLNADLPPRTEPYGKPILSEDQSTALLEARVRANGESDTLLDPVEQARDRIEASAEPGVETAVTGGAGFSADAVDVFESIDGTLLAATAGIVFLLLLIVYRSPIFWFFPMFAVGLAELATRGVGFGLTEIGVTVNGQSASILPVLVFGAGTDYALLLVARYREELRIHEDKHRAMAEALRRAGPAIIASGLTVIAALLCLTLAEVEGTAGLGPIGATGIAIAMVSMLTALPAVLVIAGRWAFWPFIPHVGDHKADETHGVWRRIGEGIARGPRRVWIGTVAVLAVMALGWLNLDTGLTQTNNFRNDVESVRGQHLLEHAFPAGASAPAYAIVPDRERAAAVAEALASQDAVADVRVGREGPPGQLLQITLADDPYATSTYDQIPGLRQVAKEAGGADVLLGGPTAIERDLRVAAANDSKLIPPIALAVVLVILIVLLRALVAPLVLIATVILSFAAALGVGYIVFDVVFGFAGSDPSLPLYAFIFLVALGVDYNIFLMARVREETRRHDPREGVLRGLAVTGAVITSAGIVLAGTFSTLAVLPLVFLTEIGFVVAFGVLLDTFVVRSILVPALALDLGGRTWWPSALARAHAGPVADAGAAVPAAEARR